MTSVGSLPAELPPEILRAVFQNVQEIWTPSWVTFEQPPQDRLGWVTLSHVCRHWHAILLEMPLLWSKISGFAPNEWMEEYIRRSQDAPLHIGVGDRTLGSAKHYQLPDIFQKMIPYLARVREVVAYGRQVQEALQAAIGPAPNLCILVLDLTESSNDNITYDLIVPSNVFAKDVPSLRQLTLGGLLVDPSSPLLSTNLTNLTLKSGPVQHLRHSRFLSLPIFIEILDRMPDLQELEMSDVLTQPEDLFPAILSRTGYLNLCNLQRLVFHSPWVENYRWFMQKLDHEKTPVRKIDMSTTLTEEAQQSVRLTLILPTKLAHELGLGGIEISSEQRKSFVLSGWVGWREEEERRQSISATITIENSSISQGILSLAAQLPLHSVKSLQFLWRIQENEHPQRIAHWAPILRMLPSLESITVALCSGRDCEDLAKGLGTEQDKGGIMHLPCPNLRRLDFSDIMADECRDGPTTFLGALATTLSLRPRDYVKSAICAPSRGRRAHDFRRIDILQ